MLCFGSRVPGAVGSRVPGIVGSRVPGADGSRIPGAIDLGLSGPVSQASAGSHFSDFTSYTSVRQPLVPSEARTVSCSTYRHHSESISTFLVCRPVDCLPACRDMRCRPVEGTQLPSLYRPVSSSASGMPVTGSRLLAGPRGRGPPLPCPTIVTGSREPQMGLRAHRLPGSYLGSRVPGPGSRGLSALGPGSREPWLYGP